MVKKIFALAMVIGVLGAFLAGCAKDDAAATDSAATTTTGGTDTGTK